jgi:hypothetical protein
MRPTRKGVFATGHHDANHADIVAALTRLGPEPIDTSKVGSGFPDLVWPFQGQTILVEVKSWDGSLTPSQKRFHDEWRGGPLIVVTCEADVLAAVESLTKRTKIREAVRG